MSATASHERWSIACSELGNSCEWRVRTGSETETERRALEHFRCAHPDAAAGPELIGRVRSAIRRS